MPLAPPIPAAMAPVSPDADARDPHSIDTRWQPQPHPRVHRASMPARPWAGHPLARTWRLLTGRHGATPQDAGRHERRGPLLRRLSLLVLVLFGAFVGTQAMAEVLPEHGANWTEKGLLVLFGVLFAWISAGFWTGAMGAWVLLRGPRTRRFGTRVEADMDADEPLQAANRDAGRTAIVMPICNENVPSVFGGLRATIESLAATGRGRAFDFYVLSDTNQPDLRAAEQVAWSELVEQLRADAEATSASSSEPVVPIDVHYRWRQRRVQRKAGNVADFCRRWGAGYRYMVVLDADSVMTGDCLTTLVDEMNAHPDAGVIQTAPRACGHDTFHARVQQFSSRVYGPLFTAGMHYWQLGESHYWGHNAILRIAPFIEHCALAPLPGRGSMSGDIMSHDFVEAALMRRAGWKVWVAYDIEGSYEQVPPNLLTELQRDRRWCHGNLQNSRLMFEPGLHPVHRMAFLTGVLAYVSAPLWFAFLLVSTLLFTRHAGEVPKYFFEPYQLFPIWPSVNLRLMLTLFGLTAVLLFAPKIFSLTVLVLRGRAREHGGIFKLTVSALIEFAHSLLLAPVRMLFHSEFVLGALSGWRLDWKSPPRDDASTSWREAWRRHGVHSLLALVWIGAIIASSPTFQWWLTPIIVGLLLAAPLSVWGSRTSLGRWLRGGGLLLIPEEIAVPRVLAEARRLAAAYPGQVDLVEAMSDAVVYAEVIGALPERPAARGARQRALTRLVERAVAGGPGALSVDDSLRLLASREALERIREAVLAGRAQSGWRSRAAERRLIDSDITSPGMSALASS